MIRHAFEELSQSLRVLLEADFRAQAGLLEVDRAEAVGNIETALSSVLNGFHSLYDAIEKELPDHPVNWYEDGTLAIVLAVRNARHHNKANRIRTLYTYHAHEAARPDEPDRYVVIDFPALEEGADTFNVFLSWGDLRELLEMPQTESRLRPRTGEAIRRYLGADRYAGYAEQCGVAETKLFFNVVPLLVNAGARIIPTVRPQLHPASTEAEFFDFHFATVLQSDLQNPEVHCLEFALPR